MADAASEEVSGSEYEAADASSSSEDEDDSMAQEASDEVSCCGHVKLRLYSACAVAQLSVQLSGIGHEMHRLPLQWLPTFAPLWGALHGLQGHAEHLQIAAAA